MGNYGSRTFSEMLEIADDAPTQSEDLVHTPINRAALDTLLDPRSPSYEITRTPIQMEPFVDEVEDPRSPSVGIARTPILPKSERKG